MASQYLLSQTKVKRKNLSLNQKDSCLEKKDLLSLSEVIEDQLQEAGKLTRNITMKTSVITRKESLYRLDLQSQQTGVLYTFQREMTSDSSVSRRHFQIFRKNNPEDYLIRTYLEDSGSLNGTYLNGYRIESRKPVEIKEGDWIFASGFSFYYFHRALFALQKIQGFKPIFKNRNSDCPDLKKQPLGFNVEQVIPPSKIRPDQGGLIRQQIDEFWQGTIQKDPIVLEAPELIPSFEKPSWFSSLGSSALIMISSMSSLLAMALRNPQDSRSILISSVTSLSMAGAFLAYGLLNRHFSIRQNLKKQKQKEQEFSDYLQEKTNELNLRIEGRHQTFLSLNWLIQNLDDELMHLYSYCGTFKVPASIVIEEKKAFLLPASRYSQRKEKGWIELEKMAAVKEPFNGYRGIESKEVYLFDSPDSVKRRAILSAWLWLVFNPNRKWIFILEGSNRTKLQVLKDMAINDLLYHPAFYVKDEVKGQIPLFFDSIQALESSKVLFFKNYDWTVFWLTQMEFDAYSSNSGLNSKTIKETGIIPETLIQQKNITWLIELNKRTTQYDDQPFSLPLINGFKTEDFSLNQILENNELSESSLMDHWTEVSSAKLRKSLIFRSKSNVQSGWDERLFDLECKASDFYSTQVNLCVQLSSNLTWDLNFEGPHALIAGMTGSGKSEGLISILLQLVLNNRPDQLQIICIDFKGSAMASVLSSFDHTAGIITNLEANAFFRLKLALDHELETRQKKIRDWLKQSPYCGGDLESYNLEHSDDPLSHLIIAVDEFASLKAKFPEAMKMLQETARIGRSLGIHLILATQKPAGVVDEQIWSNAKSHLCFKVASAQDSREMIGSQEASMLKESGEFLLKISDQEDLKRGRALYSRAPFTSSNAFKIQECSSPELIRTKLEERTKNRKNQNRIEDFIEDLPVVQNERLFNHLEEQSQKTKKKSPQQDPQTIQERITQLVLSQSQKDRNADQKKKWILHPDFNEIDFMNDLGRIDQIHEMPAFQIEQYHSILIAADDESIMKTMVMIFQTAKLPVYQCDGNIGQDHHNPQSHQERPDRVCPIGLNELWNLKTEKNESILLIQAASGLSKELMDLLLKNDKLHIVLLISKDFLRYQKIFENFDLRMASSLSDHEQIYHLFGKSGIDLPQWPEMLGAKKMGELNIRICFNEKILAKKNTEPTLQSLQKVPSTHVIQKMKKTFISNPLSLSKVIQTRQKYPFLIGFKRNQNTFEPVCWDGSALLIAYRTEEAKKKAEALLNEWIEQDSELSWGWFKENRQISIIELPDQQNLLMNEANEKELYRRQILFIGEGISASQYLLKIQVPYEQKGNSLLFNKNEIIDLDLIDIIE